MLKIKLLFIGLLILGACASPLAPINPSENEIANIQFEGPRAMKIERQRCETMGGSVSPAGLAGFDFCVIPYKDAGKICSDSADCMGQCRLNNNIQAGQSTKGQCQPTNNPFGCFNEVKNGVAEPGLCVD